jgi:YHS domain-containing protein
VQVGWRFGDRVQIVEGLSEGERVVSAGTFLVDSESRLKSVQSAPKEQPQPKLPPKSSMGTAVSANTVKDAACGMTIDPAKAIAEGHSITRDGVTYYFCSDRCKRKFSEKPERYIAANPSGPHS